jgi:hypothetical protein
VLRLRLVVVPLVLVAGLGAGSTSAAAPDARQRVRALERLVQAAEANDEVGMWATLSRVSRRRFGPTLVDFRSRGARGVHDGIAPFVRSHYRVIVNVGFPWDRSLGLVAISGGRDRGALAVPVRREGGVWKVEMDPAFTVEAVRPLPFDRVLRRTQLFAEVAAPQMIDGAIMWFDGIPFDARQYWSRDQKHMSIWGEAPQPLRMGRHTVVAFAATRREAAANAWVFTVSPRHSRSLRTQLRGHPARDCIRRREPSPEPGVTGS